MNGLVWFGFFLRRPFFFLFTLFLLPAQCWLKRVLAVVVSACLPARLSQVSVLHHNGLFRGLALCIALFNPKTGHSGGSSPPNRFSIQAGITETKPNPNPNTNPNPNSNPNRADPTKPCHLTGPYKPCTGRTSHTSHTVRTRLNIQHALGVSCMNYCCPWIFTFVVYWERCLIIPY